MEIVRPSCENKTHPSITPMDIRGKNGKTKEKRLRTVGKKRDSLGFWTWAGEAKSDEYR